MSPLKDKNDGRTYWRSLEELEGSAEFQDYLHREFPEGASELNDPFSRRGFMKVMAASFALAGGLTGCRRPEEKILPYSNAPEDIVPGKAYYVATSAPRSRGSLGLLVKSNSGRPTKIEGLPGHPANDGSTDSMAQADLLDLYNPFRQKSVEVKGEEPVSFADGVNNDFRMAARKKMAAFNAKIDDLVKKYSADGNKGKGLSFLSSPVTSPTQLRVMEAVAEKLPEAQWHSWEAINDDNSASALKTFLGSKSYDNQVVYDLSKAETLLTLDSDFMLNGRNSLKMLKDFAERRRVYAGKEGVDSKNELRFYAVESSFTLTGSNADHRLRLQSSKIMDFLMQIAREVAGNANSAVKPIFEAFTTKEDFGTLDMKKSGMDFLTAVAKDLKAHSGKSVIVVGEGQPREVHLLGLVLNQALGNIGKTVRITQRAAKTVTFTDDNLVSESIQQLVNDVNTKSVETLVILDGNPVYDAPADLKFGEMLKSVTGDVITLTLFPNETSKASTVVVPKTHYLESWSDTRSYDGTISFVQPLIAPLYSSLTEIELLSKFAGITKKGSAIVRETHGLTGKLDWEKNLQQGYIKDSGFKQVASASPAWAGIASALKGYKAAEKGTFELVFAADYSTYDGRYNNNGWMQELPDPISKLVWDNAALISYKTAQDLKVKSRDNITVKANGASIDIPCWIIPGMADNTVQITLGYGRSEIGEEKSDRAYAPLAERGYNAYSLRTKDSQWFVKSEVSKAAGSSDLVTTQDHWAMEGRGFVKEATMASLAGDHYKEAVKVYADKYDPNSPDKMFKDRVEFNEAKYQWAMVIDLNSCVGCGACTVACQAENNIPVVGKERVSEGREMHWIRMDRYFFSKKDSEVESQYTNHDLEVGALHQPIPCMQCEDAPCEQVCPVAATQHSEEGLNDMVYNRCIGTRYCLNNCPYKVRRFNYFNFQEDFKDKRFEVKKMVHNPGVTVRSRGVMEKCTYCVQRINEAKIDAKVRKDESIIDSFTTACAQVCPTKAITFGNKNSEKTEVVKMRKDARNYTLLPHLNIRPRTSFLGKVTNPNPELVSMVEEKGGHE